MEILFIPKDIHPEDLLNIHIDNIISKDFDTIKLILNNINMSYTIQSVDISKSADFILFKVNFSDLISLREESYAKVGQYISQIKELTSHLYLDEYASHYLALYNLLQEYSSDKIVLQSIKTLSLEDISPFFNDRVSEEFISNPFALYLMLFKIELSQRKVLLMQSNGIIRHTSIFEGNDVFF